MLHTKYILFALFFAANISFSVHAMDNLDPLLFDADVSQRDAAVINEIKDTASKYIENGFTHVKNKVTPKVSSTEKPSLDFRKQIVAKIKHLNDTFHERHQSEKNFAEFQENLVDTRNDLVTIPDEARDILIYVYIDAETHDLKAFLKDKKSYPHEVLDSEYKPDLRTFHVREAEKQHQAPIVHTQTFEQFEQTVIKQLRNTAFLWHAGTLAAGTVICAAVAGACYYAYKKYCEYKKKQEKLKQPTLKIVVL